MKYDDFELQIGPQSGEGLLARVLRSPAGQGEGLLRPFTDAKGSPSLNGLSTSEMEPFGDDLFRRVFNGAINDLYRESLGHARGEGSGLRIRLRINPRDRDLAALQRLPWELLYQDDTETFLALSQETPVVRSLDIPRPALPPLREPPLRVLIVLSGNPRGTLALEKELKALEEILEKNPGIEVDILKNPSPRTLRNALIRERVHILHYMGHGEFDESSGEGALLFWDADDFEVAVSGRHVATKVKDFASVRLVVLNACETALASTERHHSPFTGVATALLIGGIPAVVAMQSPIADAHAIAFSAAFYDRLANGQPLEAALAEGRQAIYSANPRGVDWAIPVLYLSALTGELFSVESRPQTGARRFRNVGRRLVILLLLATITVGVEVRRRLTAGTVEYTEVQPWKAPDGGAGTVPASSAPVSSPPRKPLQEKDLKAAPAHLSKPASSPNRGGSADGPLRFDVSADESIRVTLLTALSQQIERRSGGMDGGAFAGSTIRIAVRSPALRSFTEQGYSAVSCTLVATCRVTGSSTADLGTINAIRSHADGSLACLAAAEALAESAARAVIRQLKENS